MGKLLHISASPRGKASESLRIARTFIEAYQESHPGDEIEHWDLWDGSLPNFAIGASAKMTVFGGGRLKGVEAQAWAEARRAFDRFDSADRMLFSVPMWNASVPYVLKQLIDVISQPGWIFDVDAATGYSHLLAGRNRRIAVIYTSAVWGPSTGAEFGSNFQSTYVTDWLRWTGLTDISEIRFHPTLAGDPDAARRDADDQARGIAKGF